MRNSNAMRKIPEEGKLILLKENFRSSSEVLSVTNDVFECLMDQEVGEINYDSMHQLVLPIPSWLPIQTTRQNFFSMTRTIQVGKTRVKQKQKLTGECAWLSRRFLNSIRNKVLPFKEIALLTSSRSRNDQILLALSEYRNSCQNWRRAK